MHGGNGSHKGSCAAATTRAMTSGSCCSSTLRRGSGSKSLTWSDIACSGPSKVTWRLALTPSSHQTSSSQWAQVDGPCQACHRIASKMLPNYTLTVHERFLNVGCLSGSVCCRGLEFASGRPLVALILFFPQEHKSKSQYCCRSLTGAGAMPPTESSRQAQRSVLREVMCVCECRLRGRMHHIMSCNLHATTDCPLRCCVYRWNTCGLRGGTMHIFHVVAAFIQPDMCCNIHISEIPPVLLGIPWLALRGPLRNHFWKKRRPQPHWGGGKFWKCSGAFKCLQLLGWGVPAVLSREIPGKALRAFPGPFRKFSGISSGKSQPYWGCGLTSLDGICSASPLRNCEHFHAQMQWDKEARLRGRRANKESPCSENLSLHIAVFGWGQQQAHQKHMFQKRCLKASGCSCCLPYSDAGPWIIDAHTGEGHLLVAIGSPLSTWGEPHTFVGGQSIPFTIC